MEYYGLYSPDGEYFEVPPWRMKTLVVDHGWTFEHPSEYKPPFGLSKTKEDSENNQSDSDGSD